jgi:hypothetical protein
VMMSITNGLEYDMVSYHIQAQSVLDHRNVYSVTFRYPYPPVWIWLVTLAEWLATVTALPFVWLVKVPGLLGDLLIVGLLWRSQGTRAALFYAVNPLAIIVTAGQGQFDGLVMACVVAAWVFWRSERRAAPYWAALALGGAIALKGYPVLLLPALLFGLKAPRKQLAAGALALAPLLLAFLVYSALFGFTGAMLSHILLYNSPLFFGWSLYFPLLVNQFWPAGFGFALVVLSLAGRLAVLLVPGLLLRHRPHWPLERAWLVIFLSFYVLAPGVSPQYLLWSLPLWALLDRRLGWWFTGISLITALVFYLALFPGALPWGAQLSSQLSWFWLPCFAALNVGWWLTMLVLWRKLLRSGRLALAGPPEQARLLSSEEQQAAGGQRGHQQFQPEQAGVLVNEPLRQEDRSIGSQEGQQAQRQ